MLIQLSFCETNNSDGDHKTCTGKIKKNLTKKNTEGNDLNSSSSTDCLAQLIIEE